ncbi:hypothetical protein JKP88DRAFT_352175 [Tribonema minus]|uniref:Uncharacterized protein n=1 Tax=Tribonema minus TaxID=303371 RepID=A0A835ZN70_9STRA|nr:hypothetical protein JKP88DRAFT_352175 [Tribonema minus]
MADADPVAEATLAADATAETNVKPKRCVLSDEERAVVDSCRVILGDVFTPFVSLESAVAELESDPAPQAEIMYWKCLADTLVVYYSQTLMLPQAMAAALKRAEAGGGGTAGDDAGGDVLGGVEGDLQRLKEFDVTDEQRLGIIMNAVPRERRVALLQRLFYLTQAPPEEFAPVVQLVREQGDAAGREAVVDANLLSTWSAIREARAAEWAAAEAKAQGILEARRGAERGGGEGGEGGGEPVAEAGAADS